MKTMSHQKEEIEILRKNRNSRVEKYNWMKNSCEWAQQIWWNRWKNQWSWTCIKWNYPVWGIETKNHHEKWTLSETWGTPPDERPKRAEIISEDVMFDNIQNLRKHTNLLI